ncbi:MAG: cation acetate symporter, partial [Kutzneria sp.]|nr:cation acetate symporter [Kutzneria sp.]
MITDLAETNIGNTGLNVSVFAIFVAITLVIVYRVSHRSSTTFDYYAAGSRFTGRQNGLALAGDYLS